MQTAKAASTQIQAAKTALNKAKVNVDYSSGGIPGMEDVGGAGYLKTHRGKGAIAEDNLGLVVQRRLGGQSIVME